MKSSRSFVIKHSISNSAVRDELEGWIQSQLNIALGDGCFLVTSDESAVDIHDKFTRKLADKRLKNDLFFVITTGDSPQVINYPYSEAGRAWGASYPSIGGFTLVQLDPDQSE